MGRGRQTVVRGQFLCLVHLVSNCNCIKRMCFKNCQKETPTRLTVDPTNNNRPCAVVPVVSHHAHES